METLTLNIGGMTCGGCVKSVTRILENKNAVIEFDPAKTNPAVLIEAVEDGGYDAAL